MRGNRMTLSVLVAILMAGLTACGNSSTSDDKSASSPAPRVSVEVEERPGEAVLIQPYLEDKGFALVSAQRTNYAYMLFPSLEGKGVRLCGFQMSHVDTDWGSSSSAEPEMIRSTATKVGLSQIVYLTGWQGEASERVAGRIVVRLDEVTPELIKQKFDLSRCKA